MEGNKGNSHSKKNQSSVFGNLIKLTDWLLYFPDLNPAEHSWFSLKEGVYTADPSFGEANGGKSVIENEVETGNPNFAGYNSCRTCRYPVTVGEGVSTQVNLTPKTLQAEKSDSALRWSLYSPTDGTISHPDWVIDPTERSSVQVIPIGQSMRDAIKWEITASRSRIGRHNPTAWFWQGCKAEVIPVWTTRHASALDTRLAARPYFDFANTGLLRNAIKRYRAMSRWLWEAKCRDSGEKADLHLTSFEKTARIQLQD